MSLDPQISAYAQAQAAEMAARGIPPRHLLTPDVVRALEAAERADDMQLAPESVAQIVEQTIVGPASPLSLRIYTPQGDGPFPIVVYFHGGGWVLGNLDSHDAICRSITNEATCVVIAVDYRLAPEHKFPAALEDCFAATCWAAERASDFHGNPARLAVAGDSAGGGLAAVVAQLARERGGPVIALQMLVYPVTDLRMVSPSYAEHANAPVLTGDDMRWFRAHYIRDAHDITNPLASPLLAADLAGLPPALIALAGYDPLRDEGESYGQRLQEASVPTSVLRYDDLAHGFLGHDQISTRASSAKHETIAALRAALWTTDRAAGVSPTAPQDTSA